MSSSISSVRISSVLGCIPLLMVLVFGSATQCQYTRLGEPRQDYYNQLSPACRRLPNPDGTLSEECKRQLLAFLRFDPASFPENPTNETHAPRGMKDMVLRAFHSLAAYPLAEPPTSTIFGTRYPLGGAVPDWARYVFDRDRPETANLNRNLFNWVVDKFDIIRYRPAPPGSRHAAEYLYEVNREVDGQRRLVIHPAFWNPNEWPSQLGANYHYGAIIAHEGFHGQGVHHSRCVRTGTFDCDEGLNGPYGFEIMYLLYLLHGSGVSRLGSRPPVLRDEGIKLIGIKICDVVQNHINRPYQELADLFPRGRFDCVQDITAQWVRAREELR